MSAPRILDQHGKPIARTALGGGYYRSASSNHPTLKNWAAPRVSPHSALRFSRETLSDRIHDLVRNDGWASSATNRFVDTIVGSGWRPSAMPNRVTLGLTVDQWTEISSQIEAYWHDYAHDPGFYADAERAVSASGLLGLAVRHTFADGEALGWIGYNEEIPSRFKTCLQVIDPARLSNPNNGMDTEFCRDGVHLDSWGAAIGYDIRSAHPGEYWQVGKSSHVWNYFPRETEWGRPVIIHLREKRWAGMSRGESLLAPVAAKLKQISDYDDYEIQAASLNAILAAFVETPMDTDILADALDSEGLSRYARSEAEFYEESPLDFGGVKLTALHPGSKIGTIKGEHPHSNYEAFERNALRNIAAAGGMSYEALTADFSQANYSSIRAALVEFRKSFASRTQLVADHWQQQHYRAFLEEVFDQGLVDVPSGVPGFEENPAAWSHCKWIGPGQGWVDPLKEAQASGERLATNISTLEMEAASQGHDYREIIQQRARERAEMIAAGLDPDVGRRETRVQSTSETVESPDEQKQEKTGESGMATMRNRRVSVPSFGFRR